MVQEPSLGRLEATGETQSSPQKQGESPKAQLAKIPISFEELENRTEEMRKKAQDPLSDIHEIGQLRKALHSMDERNKEKMFRLKNSQKGIDDDFLNDKLVPRYVIFIDEEKNVMKLA